MRRWWKATEGIRYIGAVILVGFIFGITLIACGAEERKDATTEGQKVDRTPAEVIAMPNRFRNIAHKCDGHGHRVYMGSTGDSGNSSQLFVIDDPSCPGGVER